MQSFALTARNSFKAAATAGAAALTAAAATIGATAPAGAFVRHGGFHGGGFHRLGGFHGGGFRYVGAFGRGRLGGHGGHRFGYGSGRPLGGYGHRGFGLRGFAYGVAFPYGGYGARLCPIGRHFVPGLGCRLNLVRYGGGYLPFAYGYRRVARPVVFGYRTHGYGFRYAHARHFGGYGHAFHRAGFGGFGHVHRR